MNIFVLAFTVSLQLQVKYFPLFFMVDCGFSPAGVQGVYLLVPVAMLVGGSMGEKLAKQYGRVPTTAAFKAGGALSLALFCFLQVRSGCVCVFVFVFRFVFSFNISAFPFCVRGLLTKLLSSAIVYFLRTY